MREGEAGETENDHLQGVLDGHAGGMGRDELFAVVGEDLREERRKKRSRSPDEHGQQCEDGAASREPGGPDPRGAGQFRPGDGDDEASERQFEDRIGNLDDEERASDSADEASGNEGQRDVTTDIGALMPSTPGVRAELDGAVNGDQCRDRQEHAEQGKHGNAAADAEGGGQRGGEEACRDQDERGSRIESLRNELREKLHRRPLRPGACG